MLPEDQSLTASTVLVVEDDPAVCQLVQRALGRAGYRVQCATTGAEGLS